MGMVNVPVPTTLATALPEIVPNKALAMTAVFAGPPVILPVIESASFSRYCPIPHSLSTEARKMKRTTNSAEAPSGAPKIPSRESPSVEAMRPRLYPRCPMSPGRYLPKMGYRTAIVAIRARIQPAARRVSSRTRKIRIHPTTIISMLSIPWLNMMSMLKTTT